MIDPKSLGSYVAEASCRAWDRQVTQVALVIGNGFGAQTKLHENKAKYLSVF